MSDHITIERKCKSCGCVFPLTSDYWPSTPSGFRHKCKSCRAEYMRCFSKSHEESLRTWRKQYYEENCERLRENRRRYVSANAEKVREAQNKYRENNRQKAAERSRIWRAQNRERNRQTIKQWRLNNPEREKLFGLRREARKRALPSDFTHVQWRFALEYWNGCCAACGRQLRDLFGDLTAAGDHWIPLSSPECPGTTALNMLPLCHGKGGCNNSKHDHDPRKWVLGRFGKRRGAEILARIDAYFRLVERRSDGG